MSGGGGSTNTVQSATPWVGVQGGLTSLYNWAGQEAQSGGPQVYSGNETAPLNSAQTGALNTITNMTNGSNPNYYGNLNGAQGNALNLDSSIANGQDALSQSLLSGAQGNTAAEKSLLSTANGSSAADQYLQSTLGSNFLNVQNNPALNNAMNAANYNTNFNYTNDVMPALNSQYSAAGRFGSGAMGTATNQANNTLASQISNTNAGMSLADLQQLQQIQSQNAGTLGQQETTAGTNLGSLQNANAGLLNNRQGSALQLLPGLATQGLTNAQAQLGAGNQEQAQTQTNLTNLINQFNQQQMQPYNNLNLYSALLSGAAGLNTTSTSGSNTNVANPYSTALGTGTLGLGLYNSGALSGLLGGAGAAGTAGLFSSTAGLSGAALDAALAGSASAGVGAGVGGAGAAALMGLAA